MTPKRRAKRFNNISATERQKSVAFALAVNICGSAEAARSWWHTGNPHLKGRKPCTCAAKRIMTLLQRIDYNLP
jgi:uncharacterized protein (DUF2384 family)